MYGRKERTMQFRKELVGTATIPVILCVLSRGENYGYEIARAVNVETDGALEWREGTLYPALHRLEKQGLIKGEWRISDKQRRARFYILTAAGQRELEQELADWLSHTEAVRLVLDLP